MRLVAAQLVGVLLVSVAVGCSSGDDDDVAEVDAGTAEEPTGTLVTMLTGLKNPGEVAVDDVNVYFSSEGGFLLGPLLDGSIQRVDLAGENLETVSLRSGGYSNLLLDADRWFSLAYIDNVGQRIIVRSKSGGSETSIGPLGTALQATFAIDATADSTATVVVHGTDWDIVSHPFDGAATTLVAEAGGSEMLVYHDKLYWIQLGQLRSVPLGGGDATVVATFAAQPRALAADSDRLYLFDVAQNALVALTEDGSEQVTLATGQSVRDIAFRNGFVYWTKQGDSCSGEGAILRVRQTGGEPEALVEGLNCPGGIAADDASVYWVEAGTDPEQGSDGSLQKLAF